MPNGCHHLCAVTDDAQSVLRFVEGVLGMPGRQDFTIPGSNLERAMGWPAGSPSASMSMIGAGAGKLEIISAPAGLAPGVARGFVLGSVAVRDIDATVARARAMGYSVTEPLTGGLGGQAWKNTFITVGGLIFELIQYGA